MGKRRALGPPFSDAYSLDYSPYYRQTHIQFREKVRKFVDKNLSSRYVDKWDRLGKIPGKELRKKAYDAGVYGALFPKKYGGTPPEGCDIFHDLIWHDELARCGAGGVLAGVFLPNGWALSPILEHGSEELKQRVAPDLISGKKSIALAVTEPSAGSDVANIKCTAVRDGDEFVINGEKLYISNGLEADMFTVAARTGGPGHKGLTFFVVDRCEGVRSTPIKPMGWRGSGTAFIRFKNVRVPLKNVIGEINKGFIPIVSNFNHGRFVHIVTGTRYARICLEEAVKYAQERKTFGKRLVDQPVIRAKIAEMARRVISTHAWLERVAYAMRKGIGKKELSGQMALLKVQASMTLEFCAREAMQIFGGRGYIEGGRGAKVERIYREVRVIAISEGSEEILRNLFVSQARL